jgi:tetratricopeptide (TPR) repeat protein
MILGLFLYLVAFGLTAKPSQALAPPEALWLVALTSLFVAHFIEIHFGIAIVSSRVYFWFFAALLVALGTRRLTLETPESSAPQPSPALAAARPVQGATDRARRDKPRAVGAATAAKKESRRPAPARDRVSTTSLITFAFLVGFVLAVMGFDYISTNNLGALGDRTASGLDIVITALTIKNTTGGGMTSLAMLALMLTTLLVGMGVGLSEWGNPFRISVRDWASVTLLFVVLALAIFSGLVFYHVLLIASPPSAILDALLNSTILFTLYLLIVVSVCAITLLFDEPLPALWVRRTTNWVVLPVMIILAAVLIMATNIDPIRADMLYKQAAGLTGQDNAQSIDLFQRALALQPQQDYYLLFLGRTYLDAAKTATDATEREQDLQRADTALKRAREINPYNTDHSANLARLAQARGSLESNPSAQIEAYKQASDYFGQATRLSPNTAHLYDQHAQALLEYAALLQSQNDTQGAAAVHAQARDQVEHAMQVDSTFCFTYAVRAEAQASWRDRTTDALDAIQRAPNCGDVFTAEGLAVAVDALARASQEAVQANQGDAFEAMLKAAAQVKPTLEVYTTLANYYSKAGRIPEALAALDQAVAQIPASETDTLKRYQDFRFTLVNLQKALDAVRAAPNDPEAQRALAEQWLARGQSDRALPAFEKVLQLKPDDYAAQRKIVLLLIATDQLAQAQQRLAHVQAIAPAGDQVFWQRLGGVLSGIADGNHDQAVSQLDELARSADKQDYALTGALHALAAKLKIAG